MRPRPIPREYLAEAYQEISIDEITKRYPGALEHADVQLADLLTMPVLSVRYLERYWTCGGYLILINYGLIHDDLVVLATWHQDKQRWFMAVDTAAVQQVLMERAAARNLRLPSQARDIVGHAPGDREADCISNQDGSARIDQASTDGRDDARAGRATANQAVHPACDADAADDGRGRARGARDHDGA